MPSQRYWHAPDHVVKRAGMLVDRLELMFEWYKGMVDRHTGRLLYFFDPENDSWACSPCCGCLVLEANDGMWMAAEWPPRGARISRRPSQ